MLVSIEIVQSPSVTSLFARQQRATCVLSVHYFAARTSGATLPRSRIAPRRSTTLSRRHLTWFCPAIWRPSMRWRHLHNLYSSDNVIETFDQSESSDRSVTVTVHVHVVVMLCFWSTNLVPYQAAPWDVHGVLCPSLHARPGNENIMRQVADL